MPRVAPMPAAVTILYIAALYGLSSLPGEATGPDTPGWRFLSNALHVPVFAGLAVCVAAALRGWSAWSRWSGVMVVAGGYAVFDEWHQSWVPQRTTSLLDLALDLVGVLGVIVTWHLIEARR